MVATRRRRTYTQASVRFESLRRADRKFSQTREEQGWTWLPYMTWYWEREQASWERRERSYISQLPTVKCRVTHLNYFFPQWRGATFIGHRMNCLDTTLHFSQNPISQDRFKWMEGTNERINERMNGFIWNSISILKRLDTYPLLAILGCNEPKNETSWEKVWGFVYSISPLIKGIGMCPKPPAERDKIFGRGVAILEVNPSSSWVIIT